MAQNGIKHSIEEQIEDIAKQQLKFSKIAYFTKTEQINNEINVALQKSHSKSGGTGGNYPDIKLLIDLPSMKRIPVIIEVKGTKGSLIKLNKNRVIDNLNEQGKSQYQHIKKYAVNGAVHYAEAIIKYTKSFKNVIAIGLNGYDGTGNITTELGVYYVSQENSLIPKKIADYSDLSFLQSDKLEMLEKKINEIFLTDEEKERKTRDFENQIEITLKKLNQHMHDKLNIKAENRVQLVCGMIMAALGVKDKVAPLEIVDLKGELGENSNDGAVTMNKIKDFLNNKELPVEKKNTINAQFFQILQDINYYTPKAGESPIKNIYSTIKDDIMPIFQSAKHLDFTGRLFNVLNSWVSLRPGDDKNDVVLTPRYVTEFMAKLCEINLNSYVWDIAAGSGGFLVSAMKLMIEDANEKILSETEKTKKINEIKIDQLLGIEVRPDIYMLAVLNMILMGDGSSHILNENSLIKFNEKEENDEKQQKQVSQEGMNFQADVFLLNPPYSAAGKGFEFVKLALKRMKKGRAAVLIQENSGSGNGLPYTKEILQKNTLLASIRMPNKLFIGKASVQTAIYLLEVGKSHHIDSIVKFIDLSNDGYARQNRKKSSLSVNLRNTGQATERYAEVVDIVLNHKRKTHYFDDCIVEDTISLNGNDWTYSQHQIIDTKPTLQDFKKTVSDYLAWEVSNIIKRQDAEAEDGLGK